MPRPTIKTAGHSILTGDYKVKAKDERFLRILEDAIARPPPTTPKISTVKLIALSNHPTKTTVGLTKYSSVRFLLVLSRPRQTITFYSDLLDALSDPAAEAVIAHELAHAWLNEHLRPEASKERELEADEVARQWGFAPELEALDKETETVSTYG